MDTCVVWILVSALVLLLCMFSSLFALCVTRVPVSRTPLEYLPQILETMDLRPGQLVVDLGASDARTLVALCAGGAVSGRGFELNGPVWFAGFLRSLFFSNGSKVKVYWSDFFRAELEEADRVFCYLMPGSMERVGAKCAEEMRPGASVYSLMFQIPGWTPERVVPLGRLRDPLYVYRLPSSAKNLTGSECPAILGTEP